VRFINVLIFLAVICGAFWLYVYLEEFAKWIGAVEFQGSYRSTSELIFKTDIPEALIAYTVLSVCGAVLCYFLDSSVPLKWCFALGALCTVVKLLSFSSPHIQWALFNTVISLGMLIAPVFGGYMIKRRGWRSNNRSPN
jgi:predicted MFS family arabinose efflux permease